MRVCCIYIYMSCIFATVLFFFFFFFLYFNLRSEGFVLFLDSTYDHLIISSSRFSKASLWRPLVFLVVSVNVDITRFRLVSSHVVRGNRKSFTGHDELFLPRRRKIAENFPTTRARLNVFLCLYVYIYIYM